MSISVQGNHISALNSYIFIIFIFIITYLFAARGISFTRQQTLINISTHLESCFWPLDNYYSNIPSLCSPVLVSVVYL